MYICRSLLLNLYLLSSIEESCRAAGKLLPFVWRHVLQTSDIRHAVQHDWAPMFCFTNSQSSPLDFGSPVDCSKINSLQQVWEFNKNIYKLDIKHIKFKACKRNAQIQTLCPKMNFKLWWNGQDEKYQVTFRKLLIR